MQTYDANTGTAGVFTQIKAIGNFIQIMQAGGVLTIKDDKGNQFTAIQNWSGKVKAFGMLNVSSSLLNDRIIVNVGDTTNEKDLPKIQEWALQGLQPGIVVLPTPLPVTFPTPVLVGYKDQANNTQPNHGDSENIFARSADVSGQGSSLPGGTLVFQLDGEQWMAIGLDGSYVSGASARPTLDMGSGVPVLAEMWDMGVDDVAPFIQSNTTWYKIKTQGARLLTIPLASITGNGPGNAFNIFSVRGYTPWQDQDPDYTRDVINLGTIDDTVAHLSGPIHKPKNAKGAIIWVEGNFDPGTTNAIIVAVGNPRTGTFPSGGTFFTGFGSYQPALGNPQGWFCNAGSHSLGSSGTPAFPVNYGLSNLGTIFKIGIIDGNAAPGTPDTNVIINIEWIYG